MESATLSNIYSTGRLQRGVTGKHLEIRRYGRACRDETSCSFPSFFGRRIHTHRRAAGTGSHCIPERRSDACWNAPRGVELVATCRRDGNITRGQAMGTLRHINQEFGSQQGKALYNQFERALSNLSYAASLAIFKFRLASHPPNNCLIVQKLTCGGLLVLGRIVPLYECGEIPKRGCYALGDPR